MIPMASLCDRHSCIMLSWGCILTVACTQIPALPRDNLEAVVTESSAYTTPVAVMP